MKKAIFTLLIVSMVFSSAVFSEDDPFGVPPKGASPNCGPEERYSFDVRITSAQEFVEFLKKHAAGLKDRYGNRWVLLDDFKTTPPRATSEQVRAAPVDWTKVKAAVVESKIGSRGLFSLDYSPAGCPGQYFTIKMTSDGHVSVYGCCGK